MFSSSLCSALMRFLFAGMLQTVYPSSPHPLITLTHFPGTFKAKGMTSGPLDRSGAFAETLVQYHNPFSSSLTPTQHAVSHVYGAPGRSAETPHLKQVLHVLGGPNSAAYVAPEAVQVPSVSVRGNPHGELGMVQWGSDVGSALGAGHALSSFFGENISAEVNPFRGLPSQTEGCLGETFNKSHNPFLD